MVALAVVLLLFAIGALADVIAPYGYNQLEVAQIGKPPKPPSFAHPFGTDDSSHDMLSQTLYALRASARMALTIAGIAGLIGIAVGGLAGYYRGWLDRLLSALVDAFVAIPALLAALIATAAFRDALSRRRLALTLALLLWPQVARVVRASFVSLRELEYTEAARALGASDARIVFRHLLPNAAGLIIVALTSVLGTAIIIEATVSFFNWGLFGATTPTLGSLLADGVKLGIGNPFWWLYVIPAVVLGLLLLCVNFVGDSLDDALNPTRAITDLRLAARADRAAKSRRPRWLARG